MDVEIRPSTVEDVLSIAPRMRQRDREEIWATDRSGPHEALLEGLSGDHCHTGLVDGEPVCMFGVSTVSTLGQVGVIWLLGVEGLEAYSKAFLRRNKSYIEEMMGHYRRLMNLVDARNELSIRWLKWLGFTVSDEPILAGPDQLPFYEFWMERD